MNGNGFLLVFLENDSGSLHREQQDWQTTESRAAFREANTLRDHSIKSTRCNRENYGRGSDWESNDGRACLLFLALSRGACTVAGGNLCSVTLRQGGSIVWAKVSINRSSRREDKSVWVCVWASEREVHEEEEADCENETVTRESWREGCRESVAEEGAMAWWRCAWRQSDKNRAGACRAAETSLLIPTATISLPNNVCVRVCVCVEV